MKKTLILSILIMFLLTGCSYSASQLFSIPLVEENKVVTIDQQQPAQEDEKDKLDKAVSKYLEQKLGFTSIDGKVFEAHELYGTGEKEGKIYAYLWSRIQEYAYENNRLVRGSGSSMPVVVVLEVDGAGKYTAVEYKVPRDGEQYAASVKELFPGEYREKILTRVNTNGLEQIAEQKAENYFSREQNSGIDSAESGSVKLEQKVETPIFSLNVPSSWTVDKRTDNSLLFKSGDKIYGGLDILMHYSNQPVSSLFPNHSEVTEQKELEGFPVNVYMVVMKLSQPAASGDTSVVEQLHYYFLVEEYAYDLYFNTVEVDEQTGLAIAHAFRVNNAAAESSERDGDIKTATGIYTGQIDNNSIEIKIDQASGESVPAAFRFTGETGSKFEGLKLKTGDTVKIKYYKNGYDQLIVTEIEKINR